MTQYIDLHGCTVEVARNLLSKKISSLPNDCTLLVVEHGYNGGTAIRDMIRNNFRHPRVLTKNATLNPGVTEIMIRRKK